MNSISRIGGGRRGVSAREELNAYRATIGQSPLTPAQFADYMIGKPGLDFAAGQGEWAEDRAYPIRAAATEAGSLYRALRATKGDRPSRSPGAWAMVVPGFALYASRAEFLAASIYGPSMRAAWISGGTVIEVLRSGAPEIVQDDGSKWVPAGATLPEHYADNEEPGVTDMADAMQAAATYLGTVGGGDLRLLPKLYGVTKTIILPAGVSPAGSGKNDLWAETLGLGTRVRTIGPGNPQIWSDVSDEWVTEFTPVFVAGGNGVVPRDITFETGVDGDSAWTHATHYPAVKQCGWLNVQTTGFTLTGALLDQTWSDRHEALRALHPEITPSGGCTEFRAEGGFLTSSGPGIMVLGTTRNPDDFTEASWIWGYAGASDARFRDMRTSGLSINAACKNAAKTVQSLYFHGVDLRVGSRAVMLDIDRANDVVLTDCYGEPSTGNTAKVNFTSRTGNVVMHLVDMINTQIYMDGAGTGVGVNNGNGGLPFLDITTKEGLRFIGDVVIGRTGIRPRTEGGASLGSSSAGFQAIRGQRFRSNLPQLWLRTRQDGVTTPSIDLSVGNRQIRARLEKQRLQLFVPGLSPPFALDEDEPPTDPETETHGIVIQPDNVFPNASGGAALGTSNRLWALIRVIVAYIGTQGLRIIAADDSPEGVASADGGSLAMTPGGSYVKSGSGTTGWDLLARALAGETAGRPTLPIDAAGQSYFDTTLGIPVFWTGEQWVDSSGAAT